MSACKEQAWLSCPTDGTLEAQHLGGGVGFCWQVGSDSKSAFLPLWGVPCLYDTVFLQRSASGNDSVALSPGAASEQLPTIDSKQCCKLNKPPGTRGTQSRTSRADRNTCRRKTRYSDQTQVYTAGTAGSHVVSRAEEARWRSKKQNSWTQKTNPGTEKSRQKEPIFYAQTLAKSPRDPWAKRACCPVKVKESKHFHYCPSAQDTDLEVC